MQLHAVCLKMIYSVDGLCLDCSDRVVNYRKDGVDQRFVRVRCAGDGNCGWRAYVLASTFLHVVTCRVYRLGRWLFNRANDYLVLRHPSGAFMHQPLDEIERSKENDWIKQLKIEVAEAVDTDPDVVMKYFQARLSCTDFECSNSSMHSPLIKHMPGTLN